MLRTHGQEIRARAHTGHYVGASAAKLQPRKEARTISFSTLVRKSSNGILLGTLVLTAIGCSEPLTTREKGALFGGVGGAGIGALAGGGKGAAIGGAAGALGGAVIGDQMQRREREYY